MSSIEKLRERLNEVARLGQAAAVLEWDQQCYMPSGGAEARAEQSAVLQKIMHEKFTSDEMGDLLEASTRELNGAPADSDDAALLRITKMDFDRDTKVPTALVADQAKTTSLAHEEWVKARKSNDFKSFQPWLEKIVENCRKIAEYRGYKDRLYDALLDPFEPRMTTAEVERIFGHLRPQLVDIVKKIKDADVKVDDSILHRSYPKIKQQEICEDVVKRLGFDEEDGRQDQAAHPFCTTFANEDVRITTRFNDHYIPDSFFSSMHEAGHAMYEQGSPDKYEGTPLAGGTSLGFHESQSRMWENQVGRSREFIRYYFPTLQAAFPEALGGAQAEEFYRAASKVEPSLIRTDADEVTYGLHIMLRFEMEQLMVDGKVAFSDLPELWNSKMREYLGITPDSDANGVLQDVHWSSGILGYFPTYQLGNLISAQLWSKMNDDMPDIYSNIEKGNFSPILGWLREHVHQFGRKYLPGELIVRVTGKPVDSSFYIDYLNKKYGEIYNF
ncbi:MAG TPA: carboxypeptidase M32 [Fimbriimonadales bacterium]|jgi:carboxypeptidase Taq|nr:carboxypeptidase M32 [Fimbriimonadales bacterium]